MIGRMELFTPAEAPAAPPLRDRDTIPDRFKWNLTHIFPDADAWKRAFDELGTKISAYAALQGTLAQGPGDGARLLAAYKISDEIGQLSYKVWYYVALKYDEDQRDNEMNARRQQVQILFARFAQVSAWFNPELLGIPLPTVQAWMAQDPGLAVYRLDRKSTRLNSSH